MSKVLRSETRQQITTIHKISKTKSNQSIKFGELIQYNMKNIY